MPKVQKIMETLNVQPTVDAFSLEETARFKGWWSPGSPEATDALRCSWSHELI